MPDHLCRLVSGGLAAVALSLVFPGPGGAQSSDRIAVPPDMGSDSLPARRAAQLATASRSDIFRDFRFRDRRRQSGITFRHHVVDDIGVRYKAVHYDHGNGVSVADVDGDGLLDIYLLTQLGSNELWKNLGDGRFRSITTEVVAMRDRVSVGASFADVDNDGDPDLYVTTVRKGNSLFENDGRGSFSEITEQAGLTYSGHSSAGLFFDYDNDGRLDLFLVNVGVYTTDEQGRGGYYVGLKDAFTGHLFPERSERSLLYRNLDGKSFEEVSDELLLVDRSWSGDASPVDFDDDGYQDLFVLNMQGPDHYYENVRGRFFVDRTARDFPRTPAGTMGIKVFDWNRDGRFDLFLTDMHSDMTEEIGPEREKLKMRLPEGAVGLENSVLGNAFFANTGDGFREISDEIGAENYWPWGISVADLNADGWEDVFVASSMNFPFRYGINSVLMNNRGQELLDSEFILGVEPRHELVQPWFELDCASPPAVVDFSLAGWKIFGGEAPELSAAATAAGEEATVHPLCTGRSGTVTVLAARGTRSSVVFDVEGDGDLDIVTNELNAEPQVLISDLSERRPIHFLSISLVGRRSNRSGLGATVRVITAAGQQARQHDGKSGYLSQSLMPLYFGLGEERSVERIEVTWPSGIEQVVTGAVIDGLTEIVEAVEE